MTIMRERNNSFAEAISAKLETMQDDDVFVMQLNATLPLVGRILSEEDFAAFVQKDSVELPLSDFEFTADTNISNCIAYGISLGVLNDCTALAISKNKDNIFMTSFIDKPD